LRIKHSLKNTQLISINLITPHKLVLNKINALCQLFNIQIMHIATKRINHQFAVLVLDELTIEYDHNFTDQQLQKQNLLKEKVLLLAELERSKLILNNPNFLAKAPKNKVILEKSKQQQYQKRLEQINLTLTKIK
jgi:valyl-tRNA synthetase